MHLMVELGESTEPLSIGTQSLSAITPQDYARTPPKALRKVERFDHAPHSATKSASVKGRHVAS